MKYIVIGITDATEPFFPPQVLNIIQQGKVFSGGKRHHEIVGQLLPDGAQWIDITVPLDRVFEQYEQLDATERIIVFASGDPLFFGFANTIKRRLPQAEIEVIPAFNSLQMLAHRLVMPYHDMRIVSLTGRPWPTFDRALIEQAPKIGILTDREHTPAAIAQRMLDYGYDSYRMHVGEHLGHPEQERVVSLTLEEAAHQTFEFPNCVVLSMGEERGARSEICLTSEKRERWFGIPDGLFELLDGRAKMITKAPIRLLTLAALELQNKHSFWDVGFCTGSVSIEARLQFPHLQITSFEIRPEGQRLMDINSRRFGAPGIEVHIGDFCEEASGSADAIFIGGHGGHLTEIVRKVSECLLPGGVVVYNCVSPSSVSDARIRTDSRQIFEQTAAECGLVLEPALHVAINDYHPIDILKARRRDVIEERGAGSEERGMKD